MKYEPSLLVFSALLTSTIVGMTCWSITILLPHINLTTTPMLIALAIIWIVIFVDLCFTLSRWMERLR
jgi:hypothetical protein